MDIVLCIRNRLYREGLSRLLSDRPEFNRVSACCRLAELPAFVIAETPQAILIDVGPDRRGDGPSQIRTAFRSAQGRPLIVLGVASGDAEVLASVEAGAAACVSADDSIASLVGVIQSASRGELVCPPRISRMIQTRLMDLSESQAGPERLSRLSQREQQVLSLLQDRMSNKQIARNLGLEVSTIKNHVHNIIVKLAVSSRAEAAAVARRAT
ncbi:response regulator transcription factor [Maribius pontilimi]|uniref:Response regulator transcription factor n=1 Tax=Palleronia pontilimi TaxID=1964209 RepID=A0A934IJH5_9RHOB|nr:response regulator transcription factor [Palleronia pontilimi]MBJ3764455.1 response regulator transcription factor [Palleronia pontilimi]